MPAFKFDLEKLSVLRMKSGVFACLLTHLHVQRNKSHYSSNTKA